MLWDEQRETVICFMDAIAALCAPSQATPKIDKLQEQVDTQISITRLASLMTLVFILSNTSQRMAF